MGECHQQEDVLALGKPHFTQLIDGAPEVSTSDDEGIRTTKIKEKFMISSLFISDGEGNIDIEFPDVWFVVQSPFLTGSKISSLTILVQVHCRYGRRSRATFLTN
jgi:hypothetical protein